MVEGVSLDVWKQWKDLIFEEMGSLKDQFSKLDTKFDDSLSDIKCEIKKISKLRSGKSDGKLTKLKFLYNLPPWAYVILGAGLSQGPEQIGPAFKALLKILTIA